jgi:hypothetical protein
MADPLGYHLHSDVCQMTQIYYWNQSPPLFAILMRFLQAITDNLRFATLYLMQGLTAISTKKLSETYIFDFPY